MTDHPIIFSAPMVRALLDGRKTQTRRLSSSPLARVKPGDRLWVREAWAPDADGAPLWRASKLGSEPFDPADKPVKWRPSIHMPRWASRLTLIVTAAKVERLQRIDNADAIAEGCGVNFDHPTPEITREPFPVQRFKDLWIKLHGADAWDANPEVVALTFTVGLHNIDTSPAPLIDRPPQA